MTPVEPLKNAIGRNTADSTRAMPIRAPEISSIDRRQHVERRHPRLYPLESVERLIQERRLSPREAARQSIAVPIVLLGTFAVLAAFGYSINTLTMLAMVLAVGLLVDDAIVVVENAWGSVWRESSARTRRSRRRPVPPLR